MAKTPLNNLSGTIDTTFVESLNQNFTYIEEALDNCISRDGTSPNQMEADLDLNSNDILNVNRLDAKELKVNGSSIIDNILASETKAASYAADASDSADLSATSAGAAAAQAGIATTKADEASDNATNASGYATAAQAAQSAAEMAQTGAETAKTAAEAARDTASTSAATATTKAAEASTSATTATTKAIEASTSATNAAGYATSSATSATASSASADLSAAWAEGTEPGGAGTKSAKEHAQDAGASATAASDSANEAEAWAITPEDTEVTPGNYSALHYAEKAAASAGSIDPSAYQPKDDTLTSIAALGTAANKFLYSTGADTWAETDLSAYVRTTILNVADLNAMWDALYLGSVAGQDAVGFSTGVTAISENDGTKTSGTYTPDPTGGNFRDIVNGGAFTLAAPTTAGVYTMVVDITNNASAGSITFSGFSNVSGAENLTVVDADSFQVVITKTTSGATASVVAMQ